MPSWWDDLVNRTPPGQEPPPTTLPVRPGDPPPRYQLLKQPPTMRAATQKERDLSWLLGDLENRKEAPAPQTPTMRAPSTMERVYGALQTGVEAAGQNPAVRALMAAVGTSPEQQNARFTDPNWNGEVKQGVALSPLRPKQQLLNMIRRAPGVAEDAPGMQYLRQAVEYYAQKYPRLLSHLDEIVVQPSLTSQNAIGKNALNVANMDMANAGQIAQRAGGVKYLNENRRPIGTMNINADAMSTWALPEQAREVVGHELGHTGQFLSDPSRMHKAYADASDIFGYGGNPAEDLANMVGRRHRYGPEVTPLQAEDRVRARQNWDFFRSQHPRETLRGPGK